MSESEVKIHRFCLMGARAGQTVALGSSKQYKFAAGIMDIEANNEDARKVASVVERFYNAKRVKFVKGKTFEDYQPKIEEVEEDVNTEKTDPENTENKDDKSSKSSKNS